ncbi:MAG: CDP-alcohol phosphatidyltransferase family protein [Myxococcota bacterium]|nr:CDP-alcohol phosphatidyltransferase family protein [Myxococcota bacterium]
MKLKDYFTLGNLLGGFGAVLALMHDDFTLACALVYIAYACDVLDGPVARLTKQFDTFGGHFDSASDFVTNSIVTGFIVYYAFLHHAGYPWWAAATLGAFPVAFGTIRQARQQDKPTYFPCYWLGLPRPVASLFIVALLNSALFTIDVSPWKEVAHGVTAALIIVLSYLHLSNLPFCSNKERRWLGGMRFGILWFLGGSPLISIVALYLGDAHIFFEYILASLSVYIFLSWTQIPKSDLAKVRAYLNGGAVEKPLVHVESPWVPSSFTPYFDERSRTPTPNPPES